MDSRNVLVAVLYIPILAYHVKWSVLEWFISPSPFSFSFLLLPSPSPFSSFSFFFIEYYIMILERIDLVKLIQY